MSRAYSKLPTRKLPGGETEHNCNVNAGANSSGSYIATSVARLLRSLLVGAIISPKVNGLPLGGSLQIQTS